MARLNPVARQARIAAYKDKVKQKLVDKIIDTNKPEFADLKSSTGKPMDSLNGEIILERDLREDGSLKGVISIHPDNLASMLPDLKVDTEDKAGWKKYLDQFKAEGLEDVLKDVADLTPDEYELTAMEELATLDIGSMSDAEAKQKLLALQDKAKQEAAI